MSDTPGVPQNVDKSPIPEDGEQPPLPPQWNDDDSDPMGDVLAEAQRILDGA